MLSVFKEHILRFFFPWSCAGCGTALSNLDDVGFCDRCRLHLPRIQGLVCVFCGLPLPGGGMRCFRCRSAPPGVRIRAALRYSGIVPRALYRFKYFGRESLARSFAELMTPTAAQAYADPIDALIPVPLHPSAQRKRGFNQADLLARSLASQLQVPVLTHALRRHRRTRAQHGLSRLARLRNMAEAFTTGPEASHTKGKNVLLIDDVCTTGSTFVACAAALSAARPRRIQGFALARDE